MATIPPNMSCSVAHLPDEVLESIFYFLDGVSVARSLQACRRWRNLIKSMEDTRKFELWKSCCCAEIPSDITMELIGNKLVSDVPSTGSKSSAQECRSNNAFWRSSYIKWARSKDMGCSLRKKYNWLQFTLPIVRDVITCIKITGNCIVTGHASGAVQIFDANSNTFVKRVLKHLTSVTDVALVRLTNQAFECKYQKNLVFWHHHVISVGKDYSLRIGNLLMQESDVSVVTKIFNCRFNSVRVFGKLVTTLSDMGRMHMWEMELDGRKLAIQLTKEFILPGEQFFDCHWIGFFNCKVLCVDNILDRYTFDVNDSRYSNCLSPEIFPNDDYLFSDIVVTQCFIFRELITIFLSADRQLFISTNSLTYRHYSTMEYFHGYVTSVAIRGNLFAVGTNIGSVNLYYFENNHDLLTLKLDTPIWKINVSDHAVTAIDMFLDDAQPILAAASAKGICSVLFFPW